MSIFAILRDVDGEGDGDGDVGGEREGPPITLPGN